MAIEIANSIHAQCSVRFSGGSPSYIGQSNFGFAAFGTNPTDSQRIAAGQYRMRMLAPINMFGTTWSNADAKGEGQILVRANPSVLEPGFPLSPFPLAYATPATPNNYQDILVQCQTRASNGFNGGVRNIQTISASTTTASAAYVALMTANVNVAVDSPGIFDVAVNVTSSQSTTATETDFALFLDTVQQGPGATRAMASTFVTGALRQSASIRYNITGVAPGAHVFELRWKTSGGLATINPAANPESAIMVVSEPSQTPVFGDADVPFELIVLREPQQSTGG
jgi:hypothetical protein